MSALLLDASVWLAALDPDDAYHRDAAQLIEGSVERGAALAALDLTLYEVADVATARWRSPGDAQRLVELVHAACPGTLERVDGDLLAEAAAIGARHQISLYEAAHAACARRRGWTLVSTDVAGVARPGLAI
ncbi:MAG: PIN domain-containing protein [Thermoleophilaceae bacterium]